ncbi:MAG: hypothetical protein LBU83_07035 [Bacteroidales bacterium]|jgi:hypothetical protein|nr:hypothetical protein [Bacteroidales bacterium]
MKKKQYNFKDFLIVLSMILLFYSCQAQQKDNVKNQNDIISELIYNSIDTMSIDDRFWEGDIFRSYISLDFAQTTINIEDTSQISIFDKMCSVQVIPDTSWLTKRQSEMSEDDWDIIVDDIVYYIYEAEETLKKHNIPTYYASREKKYVKFIKTDKSNFVIDLTKILDAWGLILFNGNDNPVYWQGDIIDEELKEIYKK